MIQTPLTPEALSSELAAGASVADRVTDAVASRAIELATDVAVPAAKFAALRFVRNRAKGLIALAALAVAVPVIVTRLRARRHTRSDSTPAARPDSTPAENESAVVEPIPTVETRS